MCMGGGTSNVQTQEFKPPEWTTEGWKAYTNAGQALSQTPYQQSGLPQVAPVNDYQNTAWQLAYNRALYGAPDINAARGAAMNAAQGNYANPYAGNIGGIASGQAYNPWAEGVYNLAAQSNPYISDEYTNAIIANTAQEMAQGFATGTAAQNDAAAMMAGAFGGSGHYQKQQADAAALSKQIGNMASQTLQDQQRFKSGVYNQDFSNMLQSLGLGSSMYNQDVSNQLNANAQASGMWQSDIGNILSGAGLAGQLSQEDYTSMKALSDAGNNWNTYYQKLLDQYNQQWNTQSSYDQVMNEYLGSVLGRASGSYGSTAVQGPGQSPWQGLLGLGAAGAGIYTMLK